MLLRKAEIFAELQRYVEQIQSLYNFFNVFPTWVKELL